MVTPDLREQLVAARLGYYDRPGYGGHTHESAADAALAVVAAWLRDVGKATVHQALHDLDVRITGLTVEGCHCNLVTEVALKVVADSLTTTERQT